MLRERKFRLVPTSLAYVLHYFKYYHRASTLDTSIIWQNPYHEWPRNRAKIPLSSQAPSDEHAKRTEKAKKHQKMKFCLSKNIENIVGVLSFNKRFEGKNYVSTFIRDVSWIIFFFESIKSSTRGCS